MKALVTKCLDSQKSPKNIPPTSAEDSTKNVLLQIKMNF